ncbi:DUF5057 domain-containing protein [Paenibacillus albicereus]|uniref:DUF5057 domain-containing protein n=1 Tax=Paenibacillus albicereus TaxID=2726185 RepID=A0A6H2GS80_9BACL|nr:DUF5057 domain-containing protein [Paenibacillus albicereus]QJC50209.1 DUF5057 domain-containing protein [Paenibacillus albicereus]
MAARLRSALCAPMAILLLLASLLSLWPPAVPSAAAASAAKIRVLEITDNGTSDLKALLGTTSYDITTMKMKTFVASRTDIDGLYDAVYIGKGKYNPESMTLLATPEARNAAHDTSKKLNDITNLKAQELIDGYVNRGLLVMLYSDRATADGLLYQPATPDGKSGILKSKFSPYQESGNQRDNVLFLDQQGLKAIASTLKQDRYARLLALRPQLQVTAAPTDYLTDPSSMYRAGDTLVFRYSQPESSRLRANLYLNLDSSLRFQAEQVVATSDAAGPSGELRYRMPRGYSGLYYWKLELVEIETGLKSYASGAIRFRDRQTEIGVLQVLPGNDKSALTNDTVLKQSYLSTDDYRITLKTATIQAFNTKGGPFGYDSIGGKYDMLIFGFKDSYNGSAPISETAAKAVKDFIQTGQSVMFTHDTVYIASGTTDNVWTRNFKEATGQTGIQTNIGLGAPQTSTTVAKVNDGLLTRYPFNLDAGTPRVATTHDQYYMLDLEDPTLVTWYNITGGTRDNSDSWNHYYTYSKGNVTYSGTGHQGDNGTFPDWEQRLFVNTMYRAYMGSNHKPELSVHAPAAYSDQAGNFIPHYQQIPVSFTAEDPDYKDRRISAKVEFLYTGEDGRPVVRTMSDNASLLSGTLVSESYPNPLPKGGDLTVRITATDRQGAFSTESVRVVVRPVTAGLQVDRSASGTFKDAYVEKGKDFTLSYVVRPQPVTAARGQNDLVIAAPVFQEKLPPNLEPVSLPAGFQKSGSLAGGYTVTGTLPDIRYAADPAGDGTRYTAAPIPFSITAKAAAIGKLPLDQATLTYRNLGQSAGTSLRFNALTLEAIVKPTKLSLPAEVDIAIGQNYKLLLAMEPAEASVIGLKWTTSQQTNVSVAENVIGGVMVSGLTKGDSIVTVFDELTGLSASTVVHVIQPGLSLTTADGGKEYTLGSRIPLKSLLTKVTSDTVPSGAQVEWSVGPQQAGEESIREKQRKPGLLEWTSTFYPSSSETYTLNASINVLNSELKTDSYKSLGLTLNIVAPDLQLSGPSVIVAGDGKAIWTRSWGDRHPVGTDAAGRAPAYAWSWESDAGARPALSADSSGQTAGVASSAPGSGRVALKATQPLRAGEPPIELAKAAQAVRIIAKPTLAAGKNELLPGEQTQLSLRWDGVAAADVPEHTVRWTAQGAGTLQGDAAGSRTLTATKPAGSSGKATAAAVVTMSTGYSFTVERELDVIAPELALSELPQRLAAGQQLTVSASWSPAYSGSLSALAWSLGGAPAERATLTPKSGQPAKALLAAVGAGSATVSSSIELDSGYRSSASTTAWIGDFTLPASLTLEQGAQLPLKTSGLQAQPSSLASEIVSALRWGSSAPAVVSVDASGRLTAKKPGSAVISAVWRANSLPGGSLQRTIRVTVNAPSGERSGDRY